MRFKPLLIIVLLLMFMQLSIPPIEAEGSEREALILDASTEKVDLYPLLYLLEDNEKQLTIDDVSSDEFADKFLHSKQVVQTGGFFEAALWTRFEIHNESDQDHWLLELAFPLIYQIHIYSKDDSGIVELQKAGTEFPFEHREIDHRNFVFNLKVEPNTSKTFYVLLHGAGGVHPPFFLWDADSFIEKTQIEFVLLGLFYGMISVMILYNLFLYISLRLKSYLYYVFAITCTLIGQLSLNGLGFQYLWPNLPAWNAISTPCWVSLACIFIIMFARHFLDTDKYFPKFKPLSYLLIMLNSAVIVVLFISNLVALNIMLLSTTSTFATVLTVAFICLKRGARQARFFIVGWLFFLTGVFITILERAALLPFSIVSEYAGQSALVIEVVVLSLALADKINIMRAEKEKAELKAKESQSLAMESLKKADELKDEFLTITSHELRTPLYGMIGIAESIRDGITGTVSTQMSEQLSMIVTSGNRLSDLINDILDFSKLKHQSLDIHVKPVHLSGTVDIVLAICRPLIKEKPIRLINQIDASLPAVAADPNRLQQIFYNLIGNAIKYTDHGEVVITAKRKEERIKISVADTGKGIPEELQETIFEPFQQGDSTLSRDAGGTGIGLNITKQLVDLHGSTIEVDSKVGIGSTFSFTLPIEYDHELEEEAAATVEHAVMEERVPLVPSFQHTQKLATILVADDEPVNLQVLMNQLILEGYEVVTASTGEEVFRIIDEQSIELLVLDIMMPKMSGFEVCQRLRKQYSLMELPVLMLTAKNQVHDRIASFEAGANDYLAKPCDKQELLSRVKTLVRLRSLNQKLITMNIHLEEKVKERTHALKAANEDLTNLNEDLLTMAESRRHLLANIAHELGTPVTLIHSYIQALHNGLVVTDDSYFSSLVYDKINVLSRLINDLSDLSKLEAGQASLNLKSINAAAWIETIYRKSEFDIAQYGRLFEKSDIAEQLKNSSCFIDIERMDQVFSNLISNAAKNTPDKEGKISIMAELDDASEFMIIQVKDNGFGISEENVPLLFERFYKVSSPSSEDEQVGTGLGLVIVKEIVQGHQGSIWVESKVNEGSVFYISLPIQASEN